ncbi:hypothetical protein GCM10007385_08400 [Tateyamaria omphalii]|uniref:hypothetical protein n=1 Tax=Tateyamaria omphalii TaxID=299262 RepID=UPI001673B08A|nr:hypothetical protein [Tateyamaria omphalii]GGX42917.1 hypothetical protein GCM10007385_08400 [Tateyamaria omphalii]
MREFTLALAIAMASMVQVQAMPAHIPSTYPEDGTFCGFMQLCAPKATAPRPNDAAVQDQDERSKESLKRF